MSDLVHAGVEQALEDHGLKGDDVLLTYCHMFVRDCDENNHESWEDFEEKLQVMLGEEGLSVVPNFISSLRGVVQTLKYFQSQEPKHSKDRSHPVLQSQHGQPAADEPNPVMAKPPMDPHIKQQILQQFFLRPVSQTTGKAPVLSKIDYLQSQVKKNKRYRDGRVVTEKGDKYI